MPESVQGWIGHWTICSSRMCTSLLHGVGMVWSFRSLLTQTILWLYYSMIFCPALLQDTIFIDRTVLRPSCTLTCLLAPATCHQCTPLLSHQLFWMTVPETLDGQLTQTISNTYRIPLFFKRSFLQYSSAQHSQWECAVAGDIQS